MKLLLVLSTVVLCVQLSAQTTVFQCDFSSTSSYYVTSGGGDWIVTGNAPQGASSQFMGAINSTTPNEFALFDSDYLGSPGVDQNAQITLTDNISVIGFPYAYVCMNTYYKQNGADCTLDVSIDGGATWTSFYLFQNLIQGDSTANPFYQLIDISPVAGLQSTVTLRFTYAGLPGYAWMVDDVCVIASNSPTVGLNEGNSNESFNVFPNPSTGKFTIDLSAFHGELEVQISDLQGRILKSEFASPSMHSMDVELNEAAGTYLVTIIHPEGRSTETFVKK